jgi:hypothetical protein
MYSYIAAISASRSTSLPKSSSESKIALMSFFESVGGGEDFNSSLFAAKEPEDSSSLLSWISSLVGGASGRSSVGSWSEWSDIVAVEVLGGDGTGGFREDATWARGA